MPRPAPPRHRAPTIVDIARLAGVSPATVSRVLTGSVPVAADTAAEVRKAVAALGYRPNLSAQELVRGRSMAIGVLTQHPASPYYGELVRGIELGLEGTAYHAIAASGYWDAERERDALELLLARRVDGLLVLGGRLPDAALAAANEHTPLVAVGRGFRGHSDRRLRIDNRVGAAEATRHLLELGHRRIVHVAGDLGHTDSRERLRGYRDALAAAGVAEDPALVVGGVFETGAGEAAAHELLTAGIEFTAVFAASDQLAAGVQLGLHRHGLRVPDDVSLVGFDDAPSSEFATPPLTTVRQDVHEIGIAAAEGLLRLLAGEPAALPVYRTRLVVRETTATPAAPPRRRRRAR
jgi:LacI family transcriptional regulator